MANLNKVMLIGRLTRDAEVRTFSNGGKVAAFGFAVNNRKKNQSTGDWEDEPCFIDVKAFNRETGRKLADHVSQYLHKGSQVYLEGHLVLEQWEDKNGGGKRSKLVIVVDDLQFLDSKSEGAGSGGGMRSASAPAARAPQPTYAPAPGYGEEPPHEDAGGPPGREEEIPF
jgi:single-strand DNA-binding protein